MKEDALKISNNVVIETSMTIGDIKKAKAALDIEQNKFRTYDGSRLKDLEREETESKLALLRLEREIKDLEGGVEKAEQLFKGRLKRSVLVDRDNATNVVQYFLSKNSQIEDPSVY